MGFISPAAAHALLGRRSTSVLPFHAGNFVPFACVHLLLRRQGVPARSNSNYFITPACVHLLFRGRTYLSITPPDITPTPASRTIGDLIEQDAGDSQDWMLDWSTLGLGADTIAASHWTLCDPGLILSMPSFTTKTSTIWIAGGEPDGVYEITNTITTTDGRVMQKRFDCLIDP